jgi:hypothetical protein
MHLDHPIFQLPFNTEAGGVCQNLGAYIYIYIYIYNTAYTEVYICAQKCMNFQFNTWK